MKIAYLGWGSLLWNNKSLKLKTKWDKTKLLFPLNFSRISDKGKGRLTLVIDNVNGTLNHPHIASTKIKNLNKAINTLRLREKTKKNNIGYINIKDNSFRSKLLKKSQIDTIFEYAKKNNLDSIIWTDISPNFSEITGKKISTINAIQYIQSKMDKPKIYIKILKYIFLCKIYGNISTPISKTIIRKLLCNLSPK